MSNGQWWDGYEQQECVVFDDMRKDTFKFHELLRLFDRYPLRIQVKGGYREFNSKKSLLLVVQHQTICMQHDVMKTCNNCYDVLK